ncbi:MAG: hypothetical protein AAF245_06490, partial [Pseudomonadota bacterium]
MQHFQSAQEVTAVIFSEEVCLLEEPADLIDHILDGGDVTGFEPEREGRHDLGSRPVALKLKPERVDPRQNVVDGGLSFFKPTVHRKGDVSLLGEGAQAANFIDELAEGNGVYGGRVPVLSTKRLQLDVVDDLKAAG